jgi:hypothetical protein
MVAGEGNNNNDDAVDAANLPHINVTQISSAIALNLASSRQHHIPVFSGTRTEHPIKFLRTFERVSKALK